MRRHRRTIINNFNNDIDYDKLAEAIVKANNKQQESYSPSREWMKYILIPIFVGVSILSGLLSIAVFILLFKNISTVFVDISFSGVLTFIFELLIAFFTLGFCIFSIVTVREIDKENDRTYVASMFSNIVAIAALVVALVALLKEVS